MDTCVKLAFDTIKGYLNSKELPDTKKIAPELLNKKAGCFVSLHTKNDNALRGCIGTILPTCKNLASEIMSNAMAACQDPRFEPVSKNECDNLNISVDVLSKPEAIASEKMLDPKKYGVIVKSSDGRIGLLLPDLEGIDSVEKQIDIARQKAGILPDEKIYLYRFTVERHEEK